MKKIIYSIAKASLIVLLFTGCEDFLDLKPLDVRVSSNFYQTEEDAKMALVAIYDVLTYQSTPGVSWAPFITMADILSDDAYAGGSDANDGVQQQEMNTFVIPTTNTIVHSLWIKNYIGIYRANLYLEVIDGIDAPQSFKDRTIAEAKFLRAYFYFEQVRFFENIPLLTTTIKGPSEYKQTQNTPKEVYDQIALDLVEAIADLPETIPAAEAGRITKWAAQGLLARVFLFYSGVYGSNLDAGGVAVNQAYVLAELEDLIMNSGHDLFEDYADNFKLVGEFGIESVFEISYGDDLIWWDWGYVRGGNGNLSAQMNGPRVSGSTAFNRGWSFGTVNHKLAEDLAGDPRFVHTILTEAQITTGTLTKGYQHTGYISRKYTSDAEHWGSGGQFELNRTCNHRVIRFSDVLLMAAELDSPNKQDYLDRVRDRVGLPSVTATLENILWERRLELSLEGIRYFDVLRRGLAYASTELTHSETGPNYVGDPQLFEVTFNSATKGFLPIPQSEIDLSANTLKQNDGY